MFGEVKIYIGSIIEMQGNQVKVNILGTQTDFMTHMGSFGAFNKHFVPPVIGESVLVIRFEDSSLYLAFSLPAANLANPPDEENITYPDGTTLSYNSTSHTLKIESKASIHIICKEASIKADSINLGDSGGGGLITTQSICPFTGSPHQQGSSKVKAIL
ncbi:phage baseplate assembly protein V [Helicobacter sp. 13S00477-4]|uniref:phage baseplate assembly protein V n=1 Tax=Helicobacter sp. 13S00477-4 TaxID=1905759 RepID=UPI000BA6EEE2|nr:phage baseplate assembly protein V [Helicobacter sp. 13S00477-4]PAF50866.1 hypothetical protein BKH44_06880 [Helicobacter sp. 13S00477-4]